MKSCDDRVFFDKMRECDVDRAVDLRLSSSLGETSSVWAKVRINETFSDLCGVGDLEHSLAYLKLHPYTGK